MADGKPMAKSERRISPREKVQPIAVRALTSLDHKTQLSRIAHIVDASTTGFLLHVDRKELVPQKFRDALSLSELEGDQVILMIDPLNLEIGGQIVRTKRINKETYEICVDFSSDAPEYWREALIDMLPRASDYNKD
jgi:hypothetical protein